MGLFSTLTNMAINNSLSTINNAKKGRASYAEVRTAYEMLALAGYLYKMNREYDYNYDNNYENNVINYYWKNSHGEFQSISGDIYPSNMEKNFTKVSKSECSSIDFSGIRFR